MDYKEIFIRVSVALFIGTVIGWEREKSNRPAGFRTMTLVAVGTAVVTITGYLSFNQFIDITTFDPNRLAAQVVSGIGFLGAGTILREGFSIRGLTTAPSVWVVACLGIAAGAGYLVEAGIGTVIILFVLKIFNLLEIKLHKDKHKEMAIEFHCKNLNKILITLTKLIPENKGYIQDIMLERVEGKTIAVMIQIKFHVVIKESEYEHIFEKIQEIEGVENVELVMPF